MDSDGNEAPLSPMTDDDLRRHRSTTTCSNCNCSFTHHYYKVRHHCHVTGQYLFPSCNNCNLQLKPKKCKDDKYFLPVIFPVFIMACNWTSHIYVHTLVNFLLQTLQLKGFSPVWAFSCVCLSYPTAYTSMVPFWSGCTISWLCTISAFPGQVHFCLFS